jgi:hypothetical protein
MKYLKDYICEALDVELKDSSKFKLLKDYINEAINEAKEDVTRFKIDSIEQELIDNYVSKSRIKEIVKFFQTVLGPGPYYCVSYENKAGKASLKRVTPADFELVTVLEEPKDNSRQQTKDELKKRFFEIDGNKGFFVDDFVNCCFGGNAMHRKPEYFDEPKDKVISMSAQYLGFGDYFGEYEKELHNIYLSYDLGKNEKIKKYYSIISKIFAKKEYKRAVEQILWEMERNDKIMKKGEAAANILNDYENKYANDLKSTQEYNVKANEWNNKVAKITDEMKAQFNKLHAETVEMPVIDRFKFGKSNRRSDGEKLWMKAGVAEFEGKYVKVIICDRTHNTWNWNHDLTMLFVAAKDID